MSWQQTAPGRFERQFDTIERFYRGIGAAAVHLHKEHYFISSVVRLKHLPSIADLQSSWKALRHLHPQIATEEDVTGSKLTYTVPTPTDVEQWVKDTFVVHRQDGQCSADSLDTVLPPSPQLMLHVLPSTNELLFRTPHWRIDGIGLIHLQNALFTLLANGYPSDLLFDGSETSRLPPTLDEAACIPLEITPAMSQAADSELSIVFKGSNPVSFTEALPNITPASSRRIGIHLPRDITQQIITAGKARGITVTAAVQAALVIATRNHISPENGRLLCFNALNLRDRLPTPWNGSSGAVAIYHTGKPCSIDFVENKDFTSVSGLLTAHYRRDIQPLFGVMADYVPKIGAMLAMPLDIILQAPGAAHPEFGSLGLVDNHLKTTYARNGSGVDISIEDWWLGVQIINKVLHMYVWTRDGRMYLGCHYNEAFYENEFVERFLEDWREVLVREMV
ncbi:hypothetical protein BJX76DRAFT_365578 [Aspergillus varians]